MWRQWFGGDGAGAAVDWQNGKNAWGSWGNIWRTSDGGNSVTFITGMPCDPGGANAITVDPNTGTIDYFARQCTDPNAGPTGATVLRSTNRGDSTAACTRDPDRSRS